MVRVGISVEGSTEVRFFRMLLQPYLEKKNIFITPVSMRGNISLDRVRYEIKRLMHSFDYVSTFYDFYGFKGVKEEDTKEILEKRILQSVSKTMQEKLIPYIQMYEFEGLLFSSPTDMAYILQKEDIKNWAEHILNKFNGNPELINNSSQTAPSKRLMVTPYRKVTHGPNIALKIGLSGIRKKCSGFDEWLRKLECL
jgi:hypothetical protein